jgi:hypothetical protein
MLLSGKNPSRFIQTVGLQNSRVRHAVLPDADARLISCGWQGKSSKFNPHAQKVSLNHLVQDEDVVSSTRP